MSVVETQNLVKNYKRLQALREVSLTVEQGEIYGLLGHNGAGKTTLIKILLGITRNWKGQAKLLGEPVGTTDIRKRVGYLPEDHRFPNYHSAVSLMNMYGQLLGVPSGERKKRIDEMLEKVGLADRKKSKIRTYSKGMKQRLGIAQALFHDPEVIFLDEPTDGVDPSGRRQIRHMIQELRDRKKTIFVNSHLLGELELICTRVGILRRGELIREGTVEMLTRQTNLYTIKLADGQEFPEADLRQEGYKLRKIGDFWELELQSEDQIDTIIDKLRGRGLGIRHLTEKRQTLEDLFLQTMETDAPQMVQPAAIQPTLVQPKDPNIQPGR